MVTLGTVAIPIVSASDTLIVAQIPLDTAPGKTQLTVTANGSSSSAQDVTIVPAAPGILRAWNAASRGTGPVVRRGEYLALFCAGLGAVDNPPAAGANGVSNPLSTAKADVTVQIGGTPLAPAYAGLAPYEPLGSDAVGVYEVDVLIPLDAPTGDAISISVSIGGVTSNLITVAIQTEDPLQALYKWTQIGPGGAAIARAIVGGATCPAVTVDGSDMPMQVRAPATLPLYPVTSCELAIPDGIGMLSLGSFVFPLPKPDVRRITVLGDTGCRLDATRIQACNDPAQWPLDQVANSVAATQPDLIMHMGDYHYREAPCPAGNTGCANTPWGYDWAVWNADVFSKFNPMFRAAPMLIIRGNHESCDRAGEGWFRFLDPRPLPDSCQKFNDPYTVQAGPVQLFIVDSSEATDATADPALVAMLKPYFNQLANVITPNTWVAMHHPIWGFDNTTTRNLSLQVASNNSLPEGVQLVLAGHIHTFQTLTFPAARTPQILIGNGGDFLQAYPAAVTNFNGMTVGGAMVTDSALFKDFGFTTFDWNGDTWSIVSRDPSGAPVFNCTLAALAIPCKIPQ